MFGYNLGASYPGVTANGLVPGGLNVAGQVATGDAISVSSAIGATQINPDRVFISRVNDVHVPFTIKLAAGSSGAELVMNDSANNAVWEVDADGTELLAGSLGIFSAAPPAVKPVVVGSRGGNAAIASLLSALALFGFITDSTTA